MNIRIVEVNPRNEIVKRELFSYLAKEETKALFILGNLSKIDCVSSLYIAKQNNEIKGVCGFYPDYSYIYSDGTYTYLNNDVKPLITSMSKILLIGEVYHLLIKHLSFDEVELNFKRVRGFEEILQFISVHTNEFENCTKQDLLRMIKWTSWNNNFLALINIFSAHEQWDNIQEEIKRLSEKK